MNCTRTAGDRRVPASALMALLVISTGPGSGCGVAPGGGSSEPARNVPPETSSSLDRSEAFASSPASSATAGTVYPLSQFLSFQAPAGTQPTSRSIAIDGYNAAILPNGRLVTPLGLEVDVTAPKPFGLALSPDGKTLATLNGGTSRFSATLIKDGGSSLRANRIALNASFMGIVFSADGRRFYASGGDNGNLWVGDTAGASIIGSINLNGPAHPLERPLSVTQDFARYFSGAYVGALALSHDGRYLYALDQAGFRVQVVDTQKVLTGVDSRGRVLEPDNFAAVMAEARVGRYPFGIALSPDDQTLFVANVGVFQYSYLGPASPTGDANRDFPLCLPGAGYPDEILEDRTLKIKAIDATTISGLPATLRDPEGIRCGYVAADQSFTVPGLGDPNVDESSSVYVLDVRRPDNPLLITQVKTGRLVGDLEDGIAAYGASHPNAIAAGTGAIYVSNGNNDTISILDPLTFQVMSEVSLSFLSANDRRLKGIEPVALALSPDQRTLYVAEAGINAVGVLSLDGLTAQVEGHIPVGWWPSSVKVSADGKILYVASAKGRGAGPDLVTTGSPSDGVMGTVNKIDVPAADQLVGYTARVLKNNGFSPVAPPGDTTNPIPTTAGVRSSQIKHVIFINKENLSYDHIFGDIQQTRQGVPVSGRASYTAGAIASPNHHELALSFAFSDNFFLEPSVSSDGHRWLTDSYTTEFEETHWPASYGGHRSSAGSDPEVIENYPGRLGYSGSNGSPEPHDYNQHGGIYMHLVRNGRTFANFGNGFELAMVDEGADTEPTGTRQRVNIPMEKVVRDNSDHLYPEFNTHIPDSPLPEDPDRFNRYGRFKQIFESQYVEGDTCKLPDYVDLYYPNDHSGGATDINGEGGTPWDWRRYMQDNDAALGLTVQLISLSPCWKDTVIFVTEDDTQNGLDHVDGYRAPFLVISPWVKREYVSKTHMSLSSVFKTVELILGLPPLNLNDAAATDLRDMFTGTPNATPYTYQRVFVAPRANPLWAELTREMDFDEPDADEIDLRSAILKTEGLPRRVERGGRLLGAGGAGFSSR